MSPAMLRGLLNSSVMDQLAEQVAIDVYNAVIEYIDKEGGTFDNIPIAFISATIKASVMRMV